MTNFVNLETPPPPTVLVRDIEHIQMHTFYPIHTQRSSRAGNETDQFNVPNNLGGSVELSDVSEIRVAGSFTIVKWENVSFSFVWKIGKVRAKTMVDACRCKTAARFRKLKEFSLE